MIRRFTALILCLLLALAGSSSPAYAQIQEISVLCRTPDSPNGILCTMLVSGDRLYMDARTAAHLAGYELAGTMGGNAQFKLGGRKVTHTGSFLNASGQSWFPAEDIMDTLTTRIVALGGELIVNPGSPALQTLDNALENYRRMEVAVDPDDGITAFGLDLAKAFDILSNFSFTDLINYGYEREIYHAVVFSLLQRSIDPEKETFSDLFGEFETKVTSPLNDLFKTADLAFSEEVMQAFYSGSSLNRLYEIIDTYDSISGGVDFVGLIGMAEQIDFYGSAFKSGETAFRYLMETKDLTDEDQRILDVARQSIGVYNQKTGDIYSFLGDFYWEMGTNLAESALQEKMLGFIGTKVVEGVRLGFERFLPGVSAMDGLEKCAVLYRIQQIAARQIEQALNENDYLRLKYATILYYRCAYLSAKEIEKMDVDGLAGMLTQQQMTLTELEKSLLALPDSALTNLTFKNGRIYANALTGPATAYVEFYDSLLAQYGTLDVRDYYGTEYIEEGSGIIAPWMHYIGNDAILTVLRQDGSSLIQMVYLDEGNRGNPVLIDERPVLTCGANGSMYHGFADESGFLLSCSSFDTNLTTYFFNGAYVESGYCASDSNAGSMSAMRQSAWNRLYDQFGNHEPAFTVDGSNGLFTISHSPAEMRAIFLEQFNRPN